jgi:hypothetical protein
METEYTGSKYRAALLEALQLPLPTLLFRLKWEAAKRLGLHRHRYEPSRLTNAHVLDFFPLTDHSSAGLLQYFRTRTNVRFYFQREALPQIRRVWQERLPGARQKLRSEAERICRHEFSFLGSRVSTFAGDIDWHDELDGAGRWPLRHWSTIDIRSPARLGDIKRTWELNRTQFFVTLARAFVLLHDERYVRELCAQMRSWLEQNPSEMGVNWYSNLECAIRSIAWLFALEMTLDWPGWNPELFNSIVRCLIDHQHHMFQDIVYSEYCMVSNHLLGDALGIAVLSLYLPELAESTPYLDKALTVLFREGPRQILEDGASWENAVSYHRFVFYMYLLLGLLLEKNGRSMPPLLWSRLEGMCDFILHLRTPTRRICQIGDWDNGRTVILDDSDLDDFSSMLCTGAARFGRGDLKAGAGEFREESLWLLGPGAAAACDALAGEAPQPADKPYVHGGYYTWRSNWEADGEYVLFKCASFQAHTHADNLAALYSAGGKDWLVDRGTFTYNGDWSWRTYFRGTRAHNAVVVDGLGQALAHRAFRWLKHPRQRLYQYHADGRFGYAVGGTTGFQHLRSPVRHARSVLLVKGQYLLVLDALFASGHHEYELLWHIAPGHSVQVTADGTARTTDSTGANLWIRAVASSELTATVVAGEMGPIQGWHSALYGCKEPAPTVVYATSASGPIYLATLLTALLGDCRTEIQLRFEQNPPVWEDAVVLGVGGPGFADRVCLPNPGKLSERCFPKDLLWLERGGERIRIL